MTKADYRREIEELKANQRRMDARLRELEAGGSTRSPRMGTTLSDAEKVLYIREAVRRDIMGDSSMRKAWNKQKRNAPRPPLNLRGGA